MGGITPFAGAAAGVAALGGEYTCSVDTQFFLGVVEMNDALKMVADLMAVSARTAPKAGGQDFVKIAVVSGDDIQRLAQAMEQYGQAANKKNFDRDGRNVAASGAVLLLGIKDAKTTGLNCGACGHSDCKEISLPVEGSEFGGPFCAWRLIDLGVAVGSAVKTASLLNVDNRVMYRIGVAARKLGLIEADVALGIPLSASGKSVYFDR